MKSHEVRWKMEQTKLTKVEFTYPPHELLVVLVERQDRLVHLLAVVGCEHFLNNPISIAPDLFLSLQLVAHKSFGH